MSMIPVRFLLPGLALGFTVGLPLFAQENPPASPVPVIFDTDMCTDCDDAGALALVNVFMQEGQANLLACVANGRDADLSSGAAIQAIDAYYGHGSVPVGAFHGKADASGSHYTLTIHKQFAPDFPTDDKLPSGVDLYRKTLAAAADGSVVIISVGFMDNLHDLIHSKPDAASDLDGLALVAKKVKQLVVMGGSFPKEGGDFNFGTGDRGAMSADVLDSWPTPVIYSGGEIGNGLGLGKALAQTPDTNPVKMIYHLFGDSQHNALADGRQGWDPSAAWLGVRGPGEFWNVVSGGYYKLDPKTGGGIWTEDPSRKQSYITVKMAPPEVAKQMEEELARPPKS